MSKKVLFLLTFPLLLGLSLTASAQILYTETFNPPTTGGDQTIDSVGWRNAISSGNTRLFSVGGSNYGVYSFSGSPFTEAFYTTTSTGGGFTAIDLSSTTNLKFSVDTRSTYNGDNTTGYFAVQVGNNNWYVSGVAVAAPTGSFVTQTLTFDPNSWNNLTIPGNGADSLGTSATIGGAAATLSGSITGVAFIVDHVNGEGTQEFDNYSVSGTAVPEPSTVLGGAFLTGTGMLVFVRRAKYRSLPAATNHLSVSA